MSGSLVLHCGASLVSKSDLAEIQPPPPTRTWYPISHKTVLDTVVGTLDACGFTVRREQLGVSKDGHQFFGVLDLTAELIDQVTLSVAVRNSTSKKFPMALAMGSRTFCCDNLSISGERKIQKKHSRFGLTRFTRAAETALRGLSAFREKEAERLCYFKSTPLEDDGANSLILQAYERGVVAHTLLKDVIKEYREPRYDFGGPSLYRLFQAFTTVLQPRVARNPAAFSKSTIALENLLDGRKAETPLANSA
jgi:hypothetical protein